MSDTKNAETNDAEAEEPETQETKAEEPTTEERTSEEIKADETLVGEEDQWDWVTDAITFRNYLYNQATSVVRQVVFCHEFSFFFQKS